jgi:copper homeostasis protein (lipoprotein)
MMSLPPTDCLAWLRSVLLLTLAWLLAALLIPPATAQPAPIPPQTAVPGDASYAGTLPCADCAGQQIVLTLFADQTFRMHTRYLGVHGGQTQEVRDLGRWRSIDAGTLELRGGRDAPLRFSPQAGGALRLLDKRGLPIISALNYDLARQADIDRLGGPIRLRGMYLSMADTASLTECLSGKRWPMLIEGEQLALERAYLAQRSQPDHPVLAVLTASFVWREPDPGLRASEMLRVESFERLRPGEICADEAPATADFLNTQWRVVEIDGQPVRWAEGRRELHIQLSNKGNRVRGFSGCNSFSGGFEQGSDGFLFFSLEGTRKACLGKLMVQEAHLLAALGATASRLIDGNRLQLRDDRGMVRVRFEALSQQ